MSEDAELEKIKRRMLEQIMNKPPKQNILQNGQVNILTDANFDQAISESLIPVLVDFWADWCMPCKMMAPIIDTLARDYAGKLFIAKLNTEQNFLIPLRFRITSIPNFILFKDTKPIDQVLGAVGRQGLEKIIRSHII